MRDFTLNKWLLALVLLLMPWVACAAGLGRLTVLSALGQPLKAEIDLVSVQKDELSSLAVRLASPDAYKQANLQYGTALVGLRLSVEKRPNGQPYIKIASTRPVNEPFIDLLIELDWSSGRLSREYTALIDPPGYTPAQPVSPATAETRPAPAPQAPAVSAAPEAGPAAAGGGKYGPIKRGETLSKIAGGLKPEGVTLEQMLVGLYRSNPDAFIHKNMNLVRSGKILRVPEKEELSAITPGEARKVYHAQVADWKAYRGKLAESAGTVAAGGSTASGRITTRVEEKAAGEGAKDVVRLSKGEPPKGGKPRNMTERVRMLEEEAVAREKALTEANERIAELEKTIKDMQHLLEIKNPGMAAAQQQAAAAKSPAPKPEAMAAKPPETGAAKPEAAPAAKPEAPKPAVEAKSEQAKPKPKPRPKPKPKVVPPPPPEPSLLDTLLDPLYLAGGGGVIVLGGLGYWLTRRRRARAMEDDEPVKSAPTLSRAATQASDSAAEVAAAAATAAPIAAAAATDEVDPLAEAEVYIAYGRDAQAEEILKEALARHPGREDVQLKLLEIYAARKDKAAFAKLAEDFNRQTAGAGDHWLKAAAMGFALDPGNPLYAAGKDAPAASAVAPSAAEIPAGDLDFNLDGATAVTSTDIALDSGGLAAEAAAAAASGPATVAAGAATEQSGQPLVPDFALDIPAAGAPSGTDIALGAHAPAESNVIDFNIDLPKIDVPGKPEQAAAPDSDGAPATQDDSGMDFKLDLGDINLNLDDKPKAEAPAAAGGDKDGHWYDVQTKFDLAKAYQEMGDKAGAKEILQEVVKEGDTDQQTQAKKLLETLS